MTKLERVSSQEGDVVFDVSDVETHSERPLYKIAIDWGKVGGSRFYI